MARVIDDGDYVEVREDGNCVGELGCFGEGSCWGKIQSVQMQGNILVVTTDEGTVTAVCGEVDGRSSGIHDVEYHNF